MCNYTSLLISYLLKQEFIPKSSFISWNSRNSSVISQNLALYLYWFGLFYNWLIKRKFVHLWNFASDIPKLDLSTIDHIGTCTKCHQYNPNSIINGILNLYIIILRVINFIIRRVSKLRLTSIAGKIYVKIHDPREARFVPTHDYEIYICI